MGGAARVESRAEHDTGRRVRRCPLRWNPLHPRAESHPMDKSVHSFTLTPAQRRRLEKLAREAGRSPESMFRFVLRDGFEQC